MDCSKYDRVSFKLVVESAKLTNQLPITCLVKSFFQISRRLGAGPTVGSIGIQLPRLGPIASSVNRVDGVRELQRKANGAADGVTDDR